jgi:hypothetical protein
VRREAPVATANVQGSRASSVHLIQEPTLGSRERARRRQGGERRRHLIKIRRDVRRDWEHAGSRFEEVRRQPNARVLLQSLPTGCTQRPEGASVPSLKALSAAMRG